MWFRAGSWGGEVLSRRSLLCVLACFTGGAWRRDWSLSKLQALMGRAGCSRTKFGQPMTLRSLCFTGNIRGLLKSHAVFLVSQWSSGNFEFGAP